MPRLVNYVEALWPDWKPSVSEIDLWDKKLQNFDESMAKIAIDNCKAAKSGSFNKPKLYDIIENIRAQHASIYTEKKSKESNEPALAYIIECIEGERFGQQFKFYCPQQRLLPRTEPGMDRLMNEAERNRKGITNLYGSQWIILRQKAG